MNKILISIILLCSTNMIRGQEIIKTVHGRVIIKDDKGEAFIQKYSIPMSIRILYDVQNNGYCPGSFNISDSFEFDAILQQNCIENGFHGKKLYIKLEFIHAKPSGWIAPYPEKPLPNIHYDSKQNDYNIEINILIPASPTITNKLENYKIGIETFRKKPKESLIYFSESIKGNDLSYLAASANFMEQNGHQDLVYELLKNEDFTKYNVDKNTKYKLFMRRGNAARVAENYVDTLRDYAEAQSIYQRSLEPISIAYTVVLDKIGAKGLRELTVKIEKYPNINYLFENIYNEWSFSGKPNMSELGKGLTLQEWEFTANKIKSIRGGESIK